MASTRFLQRRTLGTAAAAPRLTKFRPTFELLEARRLLAAGALVGVDFDSQAFAPTNWNSYTGGATPTALTSLIDEDGDPVPFSLGISAADGVFDTANVAPLADSIPTHPNPIDRIDQNVFDAASAQFVWRGLQAGESYDVYVFGLPHDANDHEVTVTGGNQVTFQQEGDAQELWVNDERGDNSRSLDSFAEVVTADASGLITIDVKTGAPNLGLGGLAIRGPAGHFVEHDHFEESEGRITLIKPDGSEETIDLVGPTWVDVWFENEEGAARDDNNNGLDEVMTKLVNLDLAGNSSMGPVSISLNPDVMSTGIIEEMEDNNTGWLDLAPFHPGSAWSWWDLFLEVRIIGTDGQTVVLHNEIPKQMHSIINHKPPGPGDTYESPTIIPLLDENGNDTGFALGPGRHTPDPGPHFVEHDRFEDTEASFTLIGPGLGDGETIEVSGPTLVDVWFDGPEEGEADDSDGNGLDDVRTKMMELDLHGDSSLGEVWVGLNPDIMSTGVIEEHENNFFGWLDLDPFHPGDAWSWFDLYLEFTIDTPNGPVTLVNLQPKQMHETITEKPPGQGNTYESPTTIPLFFKDEAGNITDSPYSLGPGRHTPRPGHFVEHDHFEETEAQFSLENADGTIIDIVDAVGPMWVDVWFENSEGEAQDDTDDNGLPGQNGLDDVMTKVMTFDLMGTGASGMPVFVSLNPDIMSTGIIEEKENNHPGWLDLDPFHEGNANSWFDLYLQFEIVTPTGEVLRLHNRDPKSMHAMITHKPPGEGDFYESPERIELFDENGEATGIFLGPGRHVPNPGDHFVEHDHFDETEASFNLLGPNGLNVNVDVAGPTWIDVWFERGEGEAQDDTDDNGMPGQNGLEDVMTKVIDLDLTGVHPEIGLLRVEDSPLFMSTGMIEEKENLTDGILDLDPFAPGDANSWFNMFFKFTITTPDGQVVELYNIDPKKMHSMITEKPPGVGDTYENPDTIPLFALDENGNFVATEFALGPGRHVPRPHFVEHDHFHETEAQMTLVKPDGTTETIDLFGPTWVDVWFERREGQAHDDTGDDGLPGQNGRDDVMTIMRELSLRGLSSLGPIMVSLNPHLPSTGIIEEHDNQTPGVLDVPPFVDIAGTELSAWSWFDLFLEVKVSTPDGDIVLWNHRPKQLHADITHKPPGEGDTYESPETIPLFVVNPVAGDLNGDKLVNFGDLAPFVKALTDHVGYALMFPGLDRVARADVSGDGEANFGDLQPFADLLINGPGPSGFALGPARHVPNPGHFVEEDHFHDTDAEITLLGPDLGDGLTVDLRGSTWVDVWFDGPLEGDAQDDDGDGLEEVRTKMRELDLKGLSPLGAVHVGLNPDIMSTGIIQEHDNQTPGTLDIAPFVNVPGTVLTAWSWFDLFLEITVSTPDGELVLHNRDPKQMHADITHKPPGEGDVYESPEVIPLYFEDGTLSPYSLGPGRHIPNPGDHFVEHDHFEETEAQFSLIDPQGNVTTIDAFGSTWVDVWFDGPREGDAHDDNGNGLGEVMTQMVGLDMQGNGQFDFGNGPVHAPVRVGLNPLIPSNGLIEELANNHFGWLDLDPFHPGDARSWFSLFLEFEVQTPDGPVLLYNRQPKDMHSIISNKPPGPGDVYESPTTIPLFFDPQGTIPSGFALGPGRHVPNPGRHFVEKDHFDDTEAEFNLVGTLPDGTQIDEIIVARGPTWVDVWFDGPNEGDAVDNDGDGFDEVRTKMMELSLDGNSDQLGPVHVALNPQFMSTGHIQEHTQDVPGRLDVPPFGAEGLTAWSWFDLYLEFTVETPDGPLTLVNIQPKQMHADITHKPPGEGDTYESPEFIPLFAVGDDGTLSPTDLQLGPGRHIPNPGDPGGPFVETFHPEPSLLAFELLEGNQPVEVIELRGNSWMDFVFDGPNLGDAGDDNGDGRDDILALIQDIQVAGESQVFGFMEAHIVQDVISGPSGGLIEEAQNGIPGQLEIQPIHPGNGEASLFLHLEFNVGNQVLRPAVPLFVEGFMPGYPFGPGDFLSRPAGPPIPLLGPDGQTTGFAIGIAQYTPAEAFVTTGALGVRPSDYRIPVAAGRGATVERASAPGFAAVDELLSLYAVSEDDTEVAESAVDTDEDEVRDSLWSDEENWIAGVRLSVSG